MILYKPETLYVRTDVNGIQMWNIEVSSDNPTSRVLITVKYGKVGGKLITKNTVITEGKNIGKWNETSPSEQARYEAMSKWKHKRNREGYRSIKDFEEVYNYGESEDKLIEYLNRNLSLFRLDDSNLLKPMKAVPYYKKLKSGQKPAIRFPCIGQPKINGVRCTAHYSIEKDQVTLKSKDGVIYNQTTHINNALKPYLSENPTFVIDGELYIHNELLSEIVSAVLKFNINTPRVTYQIFDLSVDNIPQWERLEILGELFKENKFTELNLVESVYVSDDGRANYLTDSWIKQGYEGGIFRDKNATYQFGKRNSNMAKLKRRESAEFEILAVIPMEKDPKLGMFVCKNDVNNQTFKVVVEGTREKKQEYLENSSKYVGKKLTVEFYERTKTKLPFHAVGVAIRDYE